MQKLTRNLNLTVEHVMSFAFSFSERSFSITNLNLHRIHENKQIKFEQKAFVNFTDDSKFLYQSIIAQIIKSLETSTIEIKSSS